MKIKQPRALSLSGTIRWQLVVLPVVVVALLLLVLGKGAALVIAEVLIMIFLASSLNFLISYGGMVSFGHAAYFGLGAYGLALSVAKFGVPVWLGLAIGPIVAAVAALVFGALCVRLSHIYFAMLTLACSEITYTALFQAYDFTGGDTGITGFMVPCFGLAPRLFGAVVLAIVVLCQLLLWRLVHSPLGLAIRAIGDDPYRAAALGYSPRTLQLIAFVCSGLICGIGGTLFAVFQGNAFPEYAGIGFTIDALVMVVIGGLYSFGGGIYGAVAYTLLKTFLSRYVGEWELAIGIMLMVIVVIAPGGCAGALKVLKLKLQGKT